MATGASSAGSGLWRPSCCCWDLPPRRPGRATVRGMGLGSAGPPWRATPKPLANWSAPMATIPQATSRTARSAVRGTETRTTTVPVRLVPWEPSPGGIRRETRHAAGCRLTCLSRVADSDAIMPTNGSRFRRAGCGPGGRGSGDTGAGAPVQVRLQIRRHVDPCSHRQNGRQARHEPPVRRPRRAGC